MNRHVNKHNDKYKCHPCNFSFTTHYSLNEHNLKLHKTKADEKPNFTKVENINERLKIEAKSTLIVDNKVETYTCPLCQRTFHIKLHLEIHLEKSICQQQPQQKNISKVPQQMAPAPINPPKEPNVTKAEPILHMPILDAPIEEQKSKSLPHNGPAPGLTLFDRIQQFTAQNQPDLKPPMMAVPGSKPKQEQPDFKSPIMPGSQTKPAQNQPDSKPPMMVLPGSRTKAAQNQPDFKPPMMVV